MHPILLRLGPVTLYTYGFFMVLGFLAACWLASAMAGRLPSQLTILSQTQIVDLMCLALFGGITGARLLYVGTHWRSFIRAPLETLAIWHGGLVWYGGLLGGIAVLWLYTRIRRCSFLKVADQLVAPLALGHAIGRIGCFMNGCCYGRPTHAWFGVVFPGERTAVIPTQLLESAGLLILCAVLVSRSRAALGHPGRLTAWYGIGYGVLRFVMEFLRGDQHAVLGILTLQQLISIALLCYASGLLVASGRR